MSLSIANYNLQIRDSNGNTPLHNAIYRRSKKDIELIIQNIIDNEAYSVLNIQNNDGDTPLHVAVRRMPLDNVVDALVKLGADLTIENNDGEIVNATNDIKEFMEYVKFDLDLSDLEIDDDDVTPSLTVVNVSPKEFNFNKMPVRNMSSSPIKKPNTQSDSIKFPSSVTVEDLTPSLATEKDIKNAINKVPETSKTPEISKTTEQPEATKAAVSSFMDKILKEN
jgi:uncharacterized protein YaaR (DUF327 family)